jgi:hypothetical protein
MKSSQGRNTRSQHERGGVLENAVTRSLRRPPATGGKRYPAPPEDYANDRLTQLGRARVAQMRNIAMVLASALASAIALGACGSTAQSARTAAINAALRSLQAEVERQGGKLNRESPGPVGNEDTAARVLLSYSRPPKGVTRAEWEAAANKDQALQRAVASRTHHGPRRGQPSTAEVEHELRADVEIDRYRPHPWIRRPHGPLRSLGCRETTRGVWFCTVHFDEGLVVVERAAWYQNADALGLSLVSQRKG